MFHSPTLLTFYIAKNIERTNIFLKNKCIVLCETLIPVTRFCVLSSIVYVFFCCCILVKAFSVSMQMCLFMSYKCYRKKRETKKSFPLIKISLFFIDSKMYLSIQSITWTPSAVYILVTMDSVFEFSYFLKLTVIYFLLL